ncbi:MAG: DUF4215 domain-containing protein [Deltaproteobacteria bacterium]|nr:DUF4215 domain-containing protein [Deltaproteobacteria bacterium]
MKKLVLGYFWALVLGACSTTDTVENTIDPALCGNGVIDFGEPCDDGNAENNDACLTGCVAATCGDGFIHLGVEQCDQGAENGLPNHCTASCQNPGRCGDGNVDPGEGCDDGNASATDACLPNCVSATCGDGRIQEGVEQCDDGDKINGDGCDANCTFSCGNGVLTPPEQCDDGNKVPGDGCSPLCTLERCGDGEITGREKCDDGNTTAGDCCSPTCQPEPGCEIEPNDTLALANDAATVGQGDLIKGFVATDGDKDYFKLVVPSATTVDLVAETRNGPFSSCAATGSAKKIDSELTLYDGAGTKLGSDDEGGDGSCSKLESLGLKAGTYYVMVSGASFGLAKTFDYTLSVAKSVVVCGDNVARSSEQCDGTDLKQGTCEGKGYGPGTLKCNADCSGFDTSGCRQPVCGNSIKELREDCDDGNTADGDGCSSKCKYEILMESESNNTYTTANNLGHAPSLVQGSINPSDDEDWYRFVLRSTSDLRVTTYDGNGPPSCVSTDTRIYLYDSDGTSLRAEDDDDGESWCSLINATNDFGAKSLAPGRYYIKVKHSYGGNISAYRLEIGIDAACGNGTKEGSETCDDGNTTGGDGCNSACRQEEICGNGVVDTDEQCDDGNTTSGDGCSSECRYDLSETEPNDDGQAATGGGETGNDFGTTSPSGPYTGDSVIQASLSPAGDEDVFLVRNDSDHPVAVTLETFGPGGPKTCDGVDTILMVRNQAGEILNSDNDAGTEKCSQVVHMIPDQGQVYVHVIAAGDDAAVAKYFLSVQFP